MIPLADILTMADAKTSVEDIARTAAVTPGHIYKLLREHRPDRERKPRRCTSDIPDKIKALAAIGTKAPRIAELLKCSKAYAYRHMGENNADTQVS